MTAVGVALLHSLWAGGLVALATAVMLAVVAPSLPRLRLRIGAAALAALTAVPFMFAAGNGQPDAGWLAAVALGWAVGVATGMLRLWNSQRAVWRLRRQARPATPEWQQRLDDCASAISLNRRVLLLTSPDREVPCTLGVRRPAIIVPAGHLEHLAVDQWRAVMLHELVHVARRDYFWHLLQSLATTVLFYHPAAHWLASLINREREASCDQDAAAASDARLLAESLAAVERHRGPRAQASVRVRGLLPRVERLLDEPAAPAWTSASIGQGALGLVLCTLAARWAMASPLMADAPPPLIMATGLGLLIGLRHAIEPDHLVAVATLVTRERSVHSALRLGASWGVGHTLALFAMGSVLIVARRAVPESVGVAIEVAVAAMLVVMGAGTLADAWRANRQGPVTRHAHGVVAHSHATAGEHIHLGGMALATRPLLVGLVHGLAGSGALTALAMASLPSWPQQLGFLLVFGFGSTLGMAAVTGLAGWPLARVVRPGRAFPALSALTGAAAVIFGVSWGVPLVVQQLSH